MAEVKRISTEEAEKELFSCYTDVIGAKLGGKVITYSDEFFAKADNLIKSTPPESCKGQFTYTGAVYDGWETRRHNTAEMDWVIIKAGVASARIRGVEVDTAFFNGNHAPDISVEATFVPDVSGEPPENAQWETVIEKTPCGPSQRHFFIRPEETKKAYSHFRLNMFPDGGIARFKVFGTPVVVLPNDKNAIIDTAAVANGGIAVACSDQHFGTKDNLLLPGRGVDMSDGWETKRSRQPGHVDWVIVKLGAKTKITEIIVDTAHYRGNFPQKIKVEAYSSSNKDEVIPSATTEWNEVLSPTGTGPDKEHIYKADSHLNKIDVAYTHVKLTLIPDGGVKRFRVYGKIAHE